jgi:hypothetical protein
MKKGTVNILLIAGAAAAAWFIFTSMRRRRGSSVEAGPTIKQTEAEFIQEAEMAPDQPTFVKSAQSVVDIFKGLKRAPEAKAAAQAKRAGRKEAMQKRRVLKKSPKAKAAVKQFLTMPKAIRGIDDISVLY